MSREEVYLGQLYKPKSWEHDLSKGERSYMKEQGIGEHQFAKMDSVAQTDWKNECKNPSYDGIRKLVKK